MAEPRTLRVMISSRSISHPFKDDADSLGEIRRWLKREIEGFSLGSDSNTIFDVWINETQPSLSANQTTDQVCEHEAKTCDVLLALYNGEAGYVAQRGDVGICHAEVMWAMDSGAAKVLLIKLPRIAIPKDEEERIRNDKFDIYVQNQKFFRGTEVTSKADLLLMVQNTLTAALVRLSRGGVRESTRGRGDSGDALGWNRLDYAHRRRQMRESTIGALVDRGGEIITDDSVRLEINDSHVLFVVDAIPSALSVSAGREMVGRPFIMDHQRVSDLDESGGPVHIIACHKNATETQATTLLGFPDAMVLSTPFGIYVADGVQKIQFVLLTNCHDDTNCVHRVQSLFDWLNRNNEDEQVATRAEARARIVQAIANEATG